MSSTQSHRSNYAVLFRFCRQLADSGFLTCKEADILKDLIVCRDADLLEVAAVITHPDGMDTDDLKKLHKFFKHKVSLFIEAAVGKLYARCSLEDAYAIAGNETAAMSDGDAQVLIYGEVDYKAFADILRVAVNGLSSCKKFVDLGHGTGKAVMMAALLCDFEILVGIEILPGLVKASHAVLADYDTRIKPALTDPPYIAFIEGSFLDEEHDHFDADLVFANSTCFSASLMEDIARKAERMAVGSRVITFTVKLPSPCFKVVFKQLMRMSWGEATIFVQERVDSDGDTSTDLPPRAPQESAVSVPADEVGSDHDSEEDGDLLDDLVTDIESTNALYPMDTRSEASSLVSGMTAEEARAESPSMSMASPSATFSPGGRTGWVSGASQPVASQPTPPAPKQSPAVSTELQSPATEDASSGSGGSSDWVNISNDDFDIYDFVNKYGATPEKSS